MYRQATIYLFLSLLLFTSCTVETQRGNDSSADTLRMSYAEHIIMVKHDGYTTVELKDPWHDGQTLQTYILVKRTDSARVGNLPNGTLIYTPINRCIVFTAPHCSLISMIGAEDKIKGVCDSRYIHATAVAKGIGNSTITDCGDSMSPQVETIAKLNPEAIFLSPFENMSTGRVGKLGIPIIECADYMETSALGRAEWMRFYGMILGKEQSADSLFAVVEKRYKHLQELARQSKTKRSILTERKTGTVWYCPGGRSSMGKLISDANGGYAFAADEHSGSLPLAPETVLSECSNADVWTFIHDGSMPLSRPTLLSEYRGYAQIKAFKTGEIYACNSSTKPYFDEISFRPDYLLNELILLLHPDINTGEPLRYYEKIKEK